MTKLFENFDRLDNRIARRWNVVKWSGYEENRDNGSWYGAFNASNDARESRMVALLQVRKTFTEIRYRSPGVFSISGKRYTRMRIDDYRRSFPQTHTHTTTTRSTRGPCKFELPGSKNRHENMFCLRENKKKEKRKEEKDFYHGYYYFLFICVFLHSRKYYIFLPKV